MPKEGQIKDGKMFFNGDWVAVGTKKPKVDHSADIPTIIKVGEQEYTAFARPKVFKSGIKGYTIFLAQGQPLYGNANLFIPGSKE